MENQGVVALERAHEEAERILSEANVRAAEIATPTPVDHRGATPAATTALEALARLDHVVASTRQSVEDRTALKKAKVVTTTKP